MTSPRQIKVGLVQMRCSADPDDNVARALERVREAAARGAQVVCLPELFRSQYFCQTRGPRPLRPGRADPRPDHRGAARRWRARAGVVIVGSLFERRAAGVYHNTAVVSTPTARCSGSYRKMHIPDDPLYYEKFYFTPGDLGFQAFDTAFGRIGTLVCWDQWYPGRRPADGAGRRRRPLLPDGDRLAPGREGGVRRGAGSTPGRPCSAPTPSPTASTSRPSTASATSRRTRTGGGIEFWGGQLRRRSVRRRPRRGVAHRGGDV